MASQAHEPLFAMERDSDTRANFDYDVLGGLSTAAAATTVEPCFRDVDGLVRTAVENAFEPFDKPQTDLSRMTVIYGAEGEHNA